ncbi:MAG: hypothetical protein PUE01_11325 [Clostridiaceae bacterium]|nr:hypothetical protein [Clostridiaceae bacterium]
MDEIDDNLIVNDDDFSSMAEHYNDIADKFTGYLNTYSDSLQKILSEGIKAGKVHNNLQSFSAEVNNLKDQINSLATDASSAVTDFLSEIDTADSYLY